jgi:hypothetical protein
MSVIDLRSALPALLPLAIEWAEACTRDIATSGAPLDDRRRAMARAVGVERPELIRILLVEALPWPDHPMLRTAAMRAGLLDPGIGLTLGYAVFVCRGYDSPRVLSHEFRHVHQYEAAGSIAAFLPGYLQQIVEFGYDKAPYELDARAHEVDD